MSPVLHCSWQPTLLDLFYILYSFYEHSEEFNEYEISFYLDLAKKTTKKTTQTTKASGGGGGGGAGAAITTVTRGAIHH